MVILRVIALAVLAILGVLGGVWLTKFVRFAICETRAERVARQCKPCTCGHDDIGVHTTEAGVAVIIECLHCHRYVMGGDIIARWNAGEEDNDD